MDGHTVAFILQNIMVFIGFWFVVIMMRQKDSSVSKLMLFIAMLGLVYNVGYWLELLAQNEREAIAAMKVEYMGGAYIATFSLIFAAKYCNKKLPEALSAGLIVFDSIVLACVWSCGWNRMFYKRYRFDMGGDYPHLVFERGFLYELNAFVVVIQVIMSIKIVWDAISRSKDSQKRDRYLLLFVSALLPLLGYVVGFTGITGKYNPVPAGVTLGILAFTLAVLFQHAFDIAATAHEEMLQTLDVGIIVVDHLLGFVDANKAAKESFQGLTRVEKEERLPYEDLCRQFDGNANGEVVRNGRIFETHINEIRNTKRVIGYIMTLVDVTDRRMQLEHMQLLKENADKANNAKSDFLARMSHEIRTPINAVLGMDEMILRESGEESVKRYAMDIKSAAQSLLSIINDILDFSKIESGKMQLNPVKYDLSSLLNDLINMITIRAEKKGLELVVEVSPKQPAVLFGDDVRIRQVLVNILTNAVKYTEKGTVTLRVDGEIYRDKVVMHYEVADTGIGIREEDMPKLFKAFERIDMDHNRNVEGTGLGMNITIQLLKLMGSELKVESTYGKGSTFSFDLAQKIISKELLGNFQERLQNISKEYTYNVAFTAPDAKVLVVDDNDMNRSVFRNLVKKTHVQVTDVASGIECLAKVEKEHFDLIFLDFMMPEMDGIETYNRMKELPDNMCADTPVIMLTADAVSGARERYLKQGFKDFLSKPIVPAKLEQMMKKYLPEELLSFNVVADSAGKETEAQSKHAADVELPQIEGMDWEYAALHFPDTDLMKQTVMDFYHSLDMERDKLQVLADTIEQEESLNNYRIRVHALKSTAAINGAAPLSGLAKLLEMAAKDKDIERIKVLHPILMEEMEAYRKRLSVLEEKKEKTKPKAVKAQVLALLTMLKSALADRNYDGADMLMNQLDRFGYEKEIEQPMEQLAQQVRNLEADAAVQSAEEIIELLKGGGQ